MRAGHRVVVGLLACFIALGSTTRASAQDEPRKKSDSTAGGPEGQPQSVAVDLQRLGAELDLYAAEANRTRLASALTGLGIGSALVPSGIVLLGRSDGVSRALVIGMIVGGSAQLASVPLLLIPTRMDEIHDKFRSRPANAQSKATIREIENEWRQAAESSRRKRIVVGTTMLVGGAVTLAAGLGLLLAHEGVLGMSRKAQYTWGGVLMGTGAPVTTISVRLLLEWSLEESSWQAYRTMKSDANRLARVRLPSIGATPLPGGAMGFASMRF
jgi:hypothetical protein